MITKPADGDGDNDVIEKNLTDYSRRLIIENLSTKGITLPLKVPRVFKEVVFEKVKLKKDPVDEIIVVDTDAVKCVNGDVDDVDGSKGVDATAETEPVQPKVHESNQFDKIVSQECFKNSEVDKKVETKPIKLADVPPEPVELSAQDPDFPASGHGLKRQDLPQVEIMMVDLENMLKQRDYVFLKIYALE